MAYSSQDKFWIGEFFNNVPAKDKVHDTNLSQLKLKVSYSYKKVEKITKFEAVFDEDLINEAYLDKELSKIESHISYKGKKYSEFKLLSNKQSVEEVLIEKAVKTTIQVLHNKGLFDNYKYGNAHQVLKDYFFGRRRPDLKEVSDIFQYFCS